MSGGYTMKLKRYQDTTANGLTNCIIDWINYNGGYANRINTQGDIHAIINGRHLTIEIEIGKDELSEHQLYEMLRIIKAGGLYFVARDMETFVKYYKETFIN